MKMKKLLSALLCVCMLCALLPVGAAAVNVNVSIAGQALTSTTRYYVNSQSGGTGATFETEPANGWNAYLEIGDSYSVLHLNGLSVTTQEGTAIAVAGISKLYIELTGANDVTTTSSDPNPIGLSAPDTDLVLYGHESLAVTAQAGVAISARSITLQYPATLTVEGKTQATSARVGYATAEYNWPKAQNDADIKDYASNAIAYQTAPFVSFTPKTDATFPVWVAGVRVTSTNRNDVLGSTDTGATVTYAPAYGSASATLTLNGASISEPKNVDITSVVGIYAIDEPLALHLIGKNTVSIQAGVQTVYGVYSKMALTVTAEPGAVLETVIKNSSDPALNPAAFAVYSEAIIELSSCGIISPSTGAISVDKKRIDDNDVNKADCNVNIGRAASITYDLGGGSVATGANPTGYFVNSAPITLVNPTRQGYTFAGWTGTGLLSGPTKDVEIPTGSTGERSYTATWTAIPEDDTNYYLLRFEANGGGELASVTRSEYSVIDLAKYTPTRAGYVFTGWYADETLTEPVQKVTLRKNTTVYAGWKWNNPFSDVQENDWFYGDVEYAYQNGLLEGVTDTTFEPETPMTRAMLTTVLWRMEGEPVVNYAMQFEDVNQDQQYAEAVRWAASEKLAEGYGNGLFGADDPVTREQLVAILYRYAISKGYDVSVGEDTNILSYNDAFDIYEEFIPAFQWACGAGLVEGYDGYLMPQGEAGRAQVAAIAHRFCVQYTAGK